jgi:hypothetical protein
MQLKGRVTRFSEFAGRGLAITKIGTVSFSCAVRAESGPDPMEGDILYLEIPDPEEGELEAIVDAVVWARNQDALQVALASWKPRDQRKAKAASVSAVQHHKKGGPSAEDGMNEEARYFWYLQNIARAIALQELDSIPRTELKEMMAHITAFEAEHPETAQHIRKQVNNLIAHI